MISVTGSMEKVERLFAISPCTGAKGYSEKTKQLARS